MQYTGGSLTLGQRPTQLPILCYISVNENVYILWFVAIMVWSFE